MCTNFFGVWIIEIGHLNCEKHIWHLKTRDHKIIGHHWNV